MQWTIPRVLYQTSRKSPLVYKGLTLSQGLTYSKTCLKRPLKKKKTKIGFQDRLLLNAGQTYCRMLQNRILQYFGPSLSYHLSLKPLFCLFLSDPLSFTVYYMFVAGRCGTSISLVTQFDIKLVHAIEDAISKYGQIL